MFEFMSKLETIRDTLRTGAGRFADVVGQVVEALQSAESMLRDVEGGRVFAASPVNEEKLDALATEMHAIAAGPKKGARKPKKGEPVAAAVEGGEAKLTPGEVVQLAMLVAQLIKLIRERRRG